MLMISLQFVKSSAMHSLCSHACHTAGSKLRVRVDPGWIIVTFKGGKSALRSFVRPKLETVSLKSNLPVKSVKKHTLIAVSGMILITLSPLPAGSVSSA